MRDMVQVRRGPVSKYSGPDAKIGRSQFNRSHGLKMTFNSSLLYPILVDEVLPGDTFTCKLNGFARIFSPLDAPVMDNIELETFFFFCPSRLLWERWEQFMGAHDVAGAQDVDYTIPILANAMIVNHDPSSTTNIHQLAAFMGLPHDLQSTSIGVNAMPFRMYNFVYNEWFRDQNLASAVGGGDTKPFTHLIDNGPDPLSAYAFQTSGKKHDYFTSALPYLQKGDEITVALVGNAMIHAVGAAGVDISVWSDADAAQKKLDAGSVQVDVSATTGVEADTALYAEFNDPFGGPGNLGGVDINALRQSVAIQRLLERDARGGTRYTEILKSHFGVTSPDFRLQRPEYLGGGRSFINISPVANTSDTATRDQGELSGIGTGVISGHGWAKSFTEHGYIMGLIRARGDITYFQGVDKLWTRSTRYDFYIPALANLGEQSILNQEIFVSNDANDVLIFGYQERWAEYRTKLSRVVGNFNPSVAGSLQHWHLAEDFSTLPPLNQVFVIDQTPMARVTTVDTEEDFLLDLWFDYKCARPLPVRSIPSLTSRF